MQVWPPKELMIGTMTDDTPIHGVTMREFTAILETGFAKMYAQSRANGVEPVQPAQPPSMLLFLDFDGVLHPFLARSSADAFCYLPRLEAVLRDFPAVRVVIASTQRERTPLWFLLEQFSADIAARIVGATPVMEIRDASDVAGSRYREIRAYLGDSGASWLALDDDATLFPPGCAELVLCGDCFGDAEERALRAALAARKDTAEKAKAEP